MVTKQLALILTLLIAIQVHFQDDFVTCAPIVHIPGHPLLAASVNTEAEVCPWDGSKYGRKSVFPLRQAGQEVDSEVRGLKVRGGGGKFHLFSVAPVGAPHCY